MAQEAEAITNKRKAGNDFVGDGSGDGDCAEGDLPAMPEVPSLGVDPKSSAEVPGSYPDLVDVYIASLSDGRYGDSNNRFGYKVRNRPTILDRSSFRLLSLEGPDAAFFRHLRRRGHQEPLRWRQGERMALPFWILASFISYL